MEEITSSTYTLRVIKKREEVPGSVTIFLETVNGGQLPYKAGQFLTLIFNRPDGTEIRRSYSISSSPLLNEPLSIMVKKVTNEEISRKLVTNLEIGDTILTLGASGMFCLPDSIEDKQRFCFLAAGSGITPVFSMLKTLLYAYSETSILLIYSNRNPSSTIYLEDLKQLKKKFPNQLKIKFLYSESMHVQEGRLTLGVIDDLANHHNLYKHPQPLFYLCGPNDYMRMITMQLRVGGVKENNIKKELFVVEKPTGNIQEPPDKSPHLVQIKHQNKLYQFTVKYPDTILQAAKKLKIPIPYSCENGQCGTCSATCLKGDVWMSYNEVLGEKMLKNNIILTCTGYPINGDVELEY